jgi:hypothetical protein
VNPLSADHEVPAELQLTRLQNLAAIDRFLLIAAAAIALAFGVGFIWGTLPIGNSSKNDITVDIGAVPAVEPLILRAVDKAVAKRTNDATPMTTLAVPAAPAFLFRGSVSDFERAADCLAVTIFYEAGNEPTAGQMAVAQVVLNRARHPAYPKTVCGVVFQGHERRTGCQFSYTCDGSMARRPSPDAWDRYRGIAQAMLKGLVYPPVGLATHYHTDWVLPAWSAKLDKVRIERTHLFFRYSGYWGTPAAFKGVVTGIEPVFAKMAALSTPGTETGESEDPAGVLADEAAAAATLQKVSTELSEADTSKDIFIIYVDPLLEPAALTSVAKNACSARKKCKVFAWADQALMPRGLPLDPSDRAAMAYSYIRAADAGAGRSKWNCALFPRPDKGDCL